MSLTKIQSNLQSAVMAMHDGVTTDLMGLATAIKLELQASETDKVSVLKALSELSAKNLEAHRVLVEALSNYHHTLDIGLRAVASHIENHHDHRNAALRALVTETENEIEDDSRVTAMEVL
jgi:hypothetical protein